MYNMESKTPRQIVEELYPYQSSTTKWVIDVIDVMRETWLSRQAEVDELKEEIKFLREANEVLIDHAAKKEKELEELKLKL